MPTALTYLDAQWSLLSIAQGRPSMMAMVQGVSTWMRAPRLPSAKHLEAIFQGQRGGVMSIIAGLLTTWLPSQYPKIDIEEDGDSLVATVGKFGRIESNLLRNEAGEQMNLQNAGFFVAYQLENQTGQLAPSGSHWYDPEMPRTYETKSGLRGSFEWQGE